MYFTSQEDKNLKGLFEKCKNTSSLLNEENQENSSNRKSDRKRVKILKLNIILLGQKGKNIRLESEKVNIVEKIIQARYEVC